LDGELWSARKAFERTSGIVRKNAPEDGEWRGLKYMVFDMPAERVEFDGRLRRLQRVADEAQTEWLAAIPQARVADSARLNAMLREVEAVGGEGLMLHRGTSLYVAGRSDDLLKLKSFDDAEAQVIGYEPGKGKYEGMLGALVVERVDGAQFRIGSGLSDADRKAPPSIGSWVTYAFNGFTNSGLPRFPRYLRVGSDDR
jgi:DNA ligase-1